jgi:hypothetical protein
MAKKIQIYNREGRPLTDIEIKYLERLIDKHLVDVVQTSEGLAVRAFLVGRILADFAKKGLTAEQIEVAAMPLNIKMLIEYIGPLTRQELYAIQFAKQRSAENITQMNNEIKAQVRKVIANGLQQKKSPLVVAQELFHKFKDQQKDWRRIAITESNIAAGEGYMQRLIEDQKLRNKKETKLLGQSAVDACPWCKENIHGKVFNLVTRDQAPVDKPDDPKWNTDLWSGKNNIGRSYTKRKWVVNADGSKTLVDRPESEKAKATFGAHPNCRCWFIPYFEGMNVGKDGYVQ